MGLGMQSYLVGQMHRTESKHPNMQLWRSKARTQGPDAPCLVECFLGQSDLRGESQCSAIARGAGGV